MVDFNLGFGTEVIDGQFVNQKVRQVVDAIREYEPTIEVQYIPVGARVEGQAAYRLVHRPIGGEPYVMFTVRRDEDFDFTVLQKIMVNDQRNHQLQMSDLDLHDAAIAAVERRKYLDSIEEANDIAFHVLRTHKNTYKVNDDLIIKDGIPFNAARLKD